MKLYLSSYRIPNTAALEKLLGKKFRLAKLALIPNAKDYYADRARGVKIRDVTDYFKNLGFHPEIVDLRDYKSPAKLRAKLAGYDLIWAMGGNTFILRYEMKRSGFEDTIRGLLKEGKVYGGESAGALVAGNSLRGIEFADDPEFSEKVISDGLKLVDNFILPHVDNIDFEEAIDKARATHRDDKTLIELTDKQAYVVNGTDARVV